MPPYRSYHLADTTGIQNLTLTTVDEIPTPQAKQVLVKIHAVSLNYRDLVIAKGEYSFRLKNNLVPVSDGAGEVVAIGESVSEFKIGDRVVSLFTQDPLYC